MSIFFIVIYVILGIYVVLNFKYDLQMFQQTSQRLPRYWRWLRSDVGSTWRLVDVASLFLVMAVLLDYRLSALVAALVALSKIFLILRRKSKKPLVFTHRVWRLYTVTALIAVGTIIGLACGLGTEQLWGYYPGQSMVIIAALMLSIFSYVPVMIADIILMPVEYLIRQIVQYADGRGAHHPRAA